MKQGVEKKDSRFLTYFWNFLIFVSSPNKLPPVLQSPAAFPAFPFANHLQHSPLRGLDKHFN